MIIRRRALGALLSWFESKGYSGCTVMLHPLCCDELKCMLLALNCRLIYVDIDKQTLCSSLGSIKRMSEYSVDIFINIRSFGFSGNMEPLFSQVKNIFPGVVIIDDRCLCKPTLPIENKIVDGCADVELYSTGYSKYVDLGWGGYLVTSDAVEINYNPKYDENIYKKIADSNDSQLKCNTLGWIDDRALNHVYYPAVVESSFVLVNKHKMNNNLIYNNLLENIPSITILNEHQDWRFNILLEQRDLLKEQIFNAGFFCSSHYAANNLGAFASDCLVESNNIANNIINLFNDFRVTHKDVDNVARLIKNEFD